MKRLIAPGIAAAGLVLALAGCTNPYNPAERAVGGGLIGAGAGAAIGAAAGGGAGAATGAAVGGALGAVTGAATTPPVGGFPQFPQFPLLPCALVRRPQDACIASENRTFRHSRYFRQRAWCWAEA